jgi:hypothetical protein
MRLTLGSLLRQMGSPVGRVTIRSWEHRRVLGAGAPWWHRPASSWSAGDGSAAAQELEQVVGAAQQLPLGLTGPQPAAHEPPATLDGLDLTEDGFDGLATLDVAGLALLASQPCEHRGAQAVAVGCRGLAVLAGLAVAAVASRWDQQFRWIRDRRHVGDRPVAGVGCQPPDRIADAGAARAPIGPVGLEKGPGQAGRPCRARTRPGGRSAASRHIWWEQKAWS